MTLSQICYFAQYYFRTRGMVMITASHNPKEFNGFKFGIGYSETMLTTDIVEFRELAKSGKFVSRKPKGKHVKKDVTKDYLDDIIRRVDHIGHFKVVVDEKGNLIWNDTLVSLFSKDILDFLPGSKIVFNTLCSKQVDDVVKKAGGKAVIWLTGHSFIKAKVRDERAPFGGELSGHFYFVDNFYGHDDGAIASLRLLAYLTRKKISLKQAVNELPKYVSSPEIKVGCPDKIKFEVTSDEIGGELKKTFKEGRYTEIDGVRYDSINE